MIFLGGKLNDFRGSMPGIMEEFYFAHEHGKPIFLLGGFGGAAGVLAAAMASTSKTPPAAFDPVSYSRDPKYAALLEGYKELQVPASDHPGTRLAALWDRLVAARPGGLAGLCQNGLLEDENKSLARTEDTLEAVHLIWHGLEQLHLQDLRSKE